MDEYEKPLVLAQPFNWEFLTGKARRIRGATWIDWLWGIPAVILAIVLIVSALNDNHLADALAADGIEINADIIDKYMSSDRNPDPYITYRYVVDGRTYQRDERIRDEYYRLREIGDQVTVRYLPDSPSVARLTTRYAAPTTSLQCWLLTSITLLIGAVLWVGGKEYLSFRWSARGQVCDGVLNGVQVFRSSRQGREVRYTYAFHTPSGKKIEGARHVFRNDPGFHEPPLGSPVKVLYVDDDTHRML
ncbi:MAG: DUF3592 domain-containing protein [Anaerolinea sp.]|nr:DUF3592 domain-containing protein [Anaerolinea sp.]